MAAPSPRKTTKRTTTPKATPPAVAAISEPQKAARTYTVEDDVLHYTTKAGYDLEIDLDFSPELIKMSMGADEEDRSEDEQFDIIKESYGENFREAYSKMGILERKRLQKAVFTEFAKAMEMSLGEASGSSGS